MVARFLRLKWEIGPSAIDLGESGGAKRDRTDDLYNAIVALSQLSYSPTRLETDPV